MLVKQFLTKKFETIYRGTPVDISKKLDTSSLKGEFVVIIRENKHERTFETFQVSQVAILIRDNKCLVLRFAVTDNTKTSDLWGLPGGRIDQQENQLPSFKREIKEEIGCEAEIIRKLGDFEDKAVFDDAKVKLSAFFVELKGEIKLIDPELEEFRFIGRTHSEKLAPLVEKEIIPMLAEKGII